MKLKEFNRITHLGLQDPRMTTIGGYVMRRLARLPKPGDSLVVEGFVLEVREVRNRQIVSLILSPQREGIHTGPRAEGGQPS